MGLLLFERSNTMPITSEQMDELIQQMKIANQIRLAALMREFKMNPVQCRTEKEAVQWNTLLEEMTELAKYLDI